MKICKPEVVCSARAGANFLLLEPPTPGTDLVGLWTGVEGGCLVLGAALGSSLTASCCSEAAPALLITGEVSLDDVLVGVSFGSCWLLLNRNQIRNLLKIIP